MVGRSRRNGQMNNGPPGKYSCALLLFCQLSRMSFVLAKKKKKSLGNNTLAVANFDQEVLNLIHQSLRNKAATLEEDGWMYEGN